MANDQLTCKSRKGGRRPGAGRKPGSKSRFNSDRRRAVAQYIVAGFSRRETAEAFGVTPQTISNAIQSSEYAEECAKIQALIGRAVHLRLALLAPAALDTLDFLMHHAKSERVRYWAATTILNKALEPCSPYAPQQPSVTGQDGQGDASHLSPSILTQIIIDAAKQE